MALWRGASRTRDTGKKGYSEEEIVRVLREAEGGARWWRSTGSMASANRRLPVVEEVCVELSLCELCGLGSCARRTRR